MAGKPKEEEIGVAGLVLGGEDGFEIELKIGLTSEGTIVAKQPELEAVGNYAPEELVFAVQVILKKAVGIGKRGTAGTGGAFVYEQPGTDQMDGHGPPTVGNGKGIATDGFSADTLKGGKTEFLKEGAEPAVEGFAFEGVRLGAMFEDFGELAPEAGEAGPGAGRGFVMGFAGGEAVEDVRHAREGFVAGANAGEEIGREKAAFAVNGRGSVHLEVEAGNRM